MSNFIIAVGHTASGTIGSGASDYLDESNCTREISPLVVEYLKNAGHSVTLLRIDKGNSYNCEDCYTRANQANSIGADLYAEIHLNSGKNRTGDGAEVCVTGKSSIANEYATRVCNNLSNALKIDNRGLKIESLIVLNKTSMPAILIECMFVDCINPNIYNADDIAKAIAEGLINEDINTTKLGWNKNSTGWRYCTDTTSKSYYKDSWQQIENEWYSFDSQGYARENKWIQDKGKWYWLKNNCMMAKNEWLWIDGECYCFDTNGTLYINCKTPDGYYVDETGAWFK